MSTLPRYVQLSFTIMAACFGQSSQSISVTSSASFQRGLPPKGSLGTAFCTGLQVKGVVYATSYPLPLTLAGISIMVGGAPGPILAIADDDGYQQINFEVPQEAVANSDGSWTVAASQDGTEISTTVATLQSPGDFFLVNGNSGAFQHAADFSLVTDDNPAHAGEVLVGYLTGLPSTQPAVSTAEPAPFSPLAVVPQPNTETSVDQFALLLNGTVIANSCSVPHLPCPATNILYLGLTPGIVGVYAVVFTVPTLTDNGTVSVRLQRSTCGALFGTTCGGMGAPFFPTATAGCILLGAAPEQNVCTSSTVSLAVR